MKKALLLTSALLVMMTAFGQASNYPNGSTVADFTVTDTDGNTYSLYEITASGKHVVVDFFFAACPPCQATQATYNALYEQYGCNDHDLFVISLNNGNDNDAQVIAYEAQYGGTSAHSPAVSSTGGGPEVTAAFGVTAFPTYALIGPDNKMKNNDIWPISGVETFVNAFPAGSNIQPAECAVVGIHELASSIQSRMYPTPSNGFVTVDGTVTEAGQVSLQVIDIMGRIVHAQELGVLSVGQFTQVLDLGGLNDGNYVLRLIQGNGPASTHNLLIVH